MDHHVYLMICIEAGAKYRAVPVQEVVILAISPERHADQHQYDVQNVLLTEHPRAIL